MEHQVQTHFKCMVMSQALPLCANATGGCKVFASFRQAWQTAKYQALFHSLLTELIQSWN